MSQKKEENNFDIFIANFIFPEARSIFTLNTKSLTDIKEDCCIVVDINALLVPYTTGKQSLDQIKEIYKNLVNEDRLIIPGQIAREFAKNRTNKLLEVYQQLSRKRNFNISVSSYPLLEQLSQYQEIREIEEEISETLRTYRKKLGEILDKIYEWNWNDPISQIYNELFSADNVILDLPIDKNSLETDLNKRQLHSIPPGYKDVSKEDRGIGDLIVWHTILEVAKTRKRSVIFVSGDEKADWWHRSDSQPIYPRYELVSEFSRYSEGQSFHIISFSHFLELFGASKPIVEEIRKEEEKFTPTLKSTPIAFNKGFLEEKIFEWLVVKYKDEGTKIQIASSFFDYEIKFLKGISYGVEIRSIERYENITGELRKITSRSFINLLLDRADLVIIIFACRDIEIASLAKGKLEYLEIPESFRIEFGYFEIKEQKFTTLE